MSSSTRVQHQWSSSHSNPLPHRLLDLLAALKNDNPDQRLKIVSQIRACINSELAGLSLDAAGHFFSNFNAKMFALLMASADPHEKLGLLELLVELIEIKLDQETMITRFGHSMLLFYGHENDEVVLEASAKTLGHLARTGGALTVDMAHSHIKAAFERLHSSDSWKRLGAVFVLRELARQVPTLFSPHLALFLENIWFALKDPNLNIRTRGAEALRVALVELSRREPQQAVPQFLRVAHEAFATLKPSASFQFHFQSQTPGATGITGSPYTYEAQAFLGTNAILGSAPPTLGGGLTGSASQQMGSSGGSGIAAGGLASGPGGTSSSSSSSSWTPAPPHAVHGALLAIMELLLWTGNVLAVRYRDLCECILAHKDSKYPPVSMTVIALIPRLAALASDAFVRHYREPFLNHLVSELRNPINRDVAFAAAGETAAAIGVHIRPYLTRIIAEAQAVLAPKRAAGSGSGASGSNTSGGGRADPGRDLTATTVAGAGGTAAAVAALGLGIGGSGGSTTGGSTGVVAAGVGVGIGPGGASAGAVGTGASSSARYALACVGMLARVLGQEAAPLAERLVDGLFESGLSRALVDALGALLASVPQLLPTVQERLLEAISLVLAVPLLRVVTGNAPIDYAHSVGAGTGVVVMSGPEAGEYVTTDGSGNVLNTPVVPPATNISTLLAGGYTPDGSGVATQLASGVAANTQTSTTPQGIPTTTPGAGHVQGSAGAGSGQANVNATLNAAGVLTGGNATQSFTSTDRLTVFAAPTLRQRLTAAIGKSRLSLAEVRVDAGLVAFALDTLGTFGFDFRGTRALTLAREYLPHYLSYTESVTVRHSAVACCCQILPALFTGAANSPPARAAAYDLVKRLATVAASDPIAAIRLTAVSSLDPRIDVALAQSEVLQPLSLTLNDSSPAVQECALSLFARLAPRNPAAIRPFLRSVLLRTLEDIQMSELEPSQYMDAALSHNLVNSGVGGTAGNAGFAGGITAFQAGAALTAAATAQLDMEFAQAAAQNANGLPVLDSKSSLVHKAKLLAIFLDQCPQIIKPYMGLITNVIMSKIPGFVLSTTHRGGLLMSLDVTLANAVNSLQKSLGLQQDGTQSGDSSTGRGAGSLMAAQGGDGDAVGDAVADAQASTDPDHTKGGKFGSFGTSGLVFLPHVRADSPLTQSQMGGVCLGQLLGVGAFPSIADALLLPCTPGQGYGTGALGAAAAAATAGLGLGFGLGLNSPAATTESGLAALNATIAAACAGSPAALELLNTISATTPMRLSQPLLEHAATRVPAIVLSVLGRLMWESGPVLCGALPWLVPLLAHIIDDNATPYVKRHVALHTLYQCIAATGQSIAALIACPRLPAILFRRARMEPTPAARLEYLRVLGVLGAVEPLKCALSESGFGFALLKGQRPVAGVPPSLMEAKPYKSPFAAELIAQERGDGMDLEEDDGRVAVGSGGRLPPLDEGSEASFAAPPTPTGASSNVSEAYLNVNVPAQPIPTGRPLESSAMDAELDSVEEDEKPGADRPSIIVLEGDDAGVDGLVLGVLPPWARVDQESAEESANAKGSALGSTPDTHQCPGGALVVRGRDSFPRGTAGASSATNARASGLDGVGGPDYFQSLYRRGGVPTLDGAGPGWKVFAGIFAPAEDDSSLDGQFMLENFKPSGNWFAVPQAAANALLGVLRDRTLSHLHTPALTALMFTIRGLGSSSLALLPKVTSTLVRLALRSEPGLRLVCLEHLRTITGLAGTEINKQFDELLGLLLTLWRYSDPATALVTAVADQVYVGTKGEVLALREMFPDGIPGLAAAAAIAAAAADDGSVDGGYQAQGGAPGALAVAIAVANAAQATASAPVLPGGAADPSSTPQSAQGATGGVAGGVPVSDGGDADGELGGIQAHHVHLTPALLRCMLVLLHDLISAHPSSVVPHLPLVLPRLMQVVGTEPKLQAAAAKSGVGAISGGSRELTLMALNTILLVIRRSPVALDQYGEMLVQPLIRLAASPIEAFAPRAAALHTLARFVAVTDVRPYAPTVLHPLSGIISDFTSSALHEDALLLLCVVLRQVGFAYIVFEPHIRSALLRLKQHAFGTTIPARTILGALTISHNPSPANPVNALNAAKGAINATLTTGRLCTAPRSPQLVTAGQGSAGASQAKYPGMETLGTASHPNMGRSAYSTSDTGVGPSANQTAGSFALEKYPHGAPLLALATPGAMLSAYIVPGSILNAGATTGTSGAPTAGDPTTAGTLSGRGSTSQSTALTNTGGITVGHLIASDPLLKGSGIAGLMAALDRLSPPPQNELAWVAAARAALTVGLTLSLPSGQALDLCDFTLLMHIDRYETLVGRLFEAIVTSQELYKRRRGGLVPGLHTAGAVTIAQVLASQNLVASSAGPIPIPTMAQAGTNSGAVTVCPSGAVHVDLNYIMPRNTSSNSSAGLGQPDRGAIIKGVPQGYTMTESKPVVAIDRVLPAGLETRDVSVDPNNRQKKQVLQLQQATQNLLGGPAYAGQALANALVANASAPGGDVTLYDPQSYAAGTLDDFSVDVDSLQTTSPADWFMQDPGIWLPNNDFVGALNGGLGAGALLLTEDGMAPLGGPNAPAAPGATSSGQASSSAAAIAGGMGLPNAKGGKCIDTIAIGWIDLGAGPHGAAALAQPGLEMATDIQAVKGAYGPLPEAKAVEQANQAAGAGAAAQGAAQGGAPGGAGNGTANSSSSTPALPPPMLESLTPKLQVSADQLKRVWRDRDKTSSEDWEIWLLTFAIELLKQSPSGSLRACSALAAKHPPLAHSLFNAAFLSCWTELDDASQDDFVENIRLITSTHDVPTNVIHRIIDLFEFMTRHGRSIPFDSARLAKLAEDSQRLACALYHREQSFLANPSTATTEALISLNNRLDLPLAARGLLALAQTHGAVSVKEQWYEELHQWEEALCAYTRKQLDSPRDAASMLGRMRAQKELADWAALGSLAEVFWHATPNRPDLRCAAAPLAAAAAFHLQDWEALAGYVSYVAADTLEGAMLRAVLAISRNDIAHAQHWINISALAVAEHICYTSAPSVIGAGTKDTSTSSRPATQPGAAQSATASALSGSATTLRSTETPTLAVADEYAAVFPSILAAQQLTELHEVLEYKTGSARRRATIRQMWHNRLKVVPYDMTVWQSLLSLRSLVLTSAECADSWLKFAQLCRRSGRLNLSLKTLNQLMEMDSTLIVTALNTPLPNTHPALLFACLSHHYESGHRKEAYLRLLELTYSPSLARVERGGQATPHPVAPPDLVTIGQVRRRSLLRQQAMQAVQAATLHAPVLTVTQSNTTDDQSSHKSASSALSSSVTSSVTHISPLHTTTAVAAPAASFASNGPFGAPSAALLGKCYLALGRWRLQALEEHTSLTVPSEIAASAVALGLCDESEARAANEGGFGNGVSPTTGAWFMNATQSLQTLSQPSHLVVSTQATSTEYSAPTYAYGEGKYGNPGPKSGIRQCLYFLKQAVECLPESYDAWHEWALLHFRLANNSALAKIGARSVHSKGPKGSRSTRSGGEVDGRASADDSISPEACIVPAIRGLFKSVSLSKGMGSSTIQDVLRILSAWLQFGHRRDAARAIAAGLRTIPIEAWLDIIPQIIARLQTPKESVRRRLLQLIDNIGKAHPQAIIYALTVATKTNNQRRRQSALEGLAHMRLHSQVLVNQAVVISTELIRAAALRHELWHAQIEEAAKFYNDPKQHQTMLNILLPLHAELERGSETVKEMQFEAQFGQDLAQAGTLIRRFAADRTKTDALAQAWNFYSQVYQALGKIVGTFTKLDLEEVSPKLLAARDLAVAVPGTYHAFRPVVCISSFNRYLNVIESKQRPRKLRLTGTDGKSYQFLLKGHEDLRQDERAMQMFGLVNALLEHPSGSGSNSDRASGSTASGSGGSGGVADADLGFEARSPGYHSSHYRAALESVLAAAAHQRLSSASFTLTSSGARTANSSAAAAAAAAAAAYVANAVPGSATDGSKSNSYGGSLAIRRYSVTPLAPASGLIEWVEQTDTLFDLIKYYRDAKQILINIEHRIMYRMAPHLNLSTVIQRVEVFEHCLSATSGQDLREVLWLRTPNADIWLRNRNNYSRSLAVMSMVGYLLGLGDRHPCNIMIDRVTGKVVHIDFGDCFEVAMQREKFPEKVPFRLTRMLINAMEVSGVEGTFRHTCDYVMREMRENRNSVMAVLEAFVYDPLMNWSSFVQKMTAPATTHTNDSAGPMDGVANGVVQPGMARSVVGSVMAHKRLFIPEEDGVAGENSHRMAVSVLARVEAKLRGKDFPEPNGETKVLTVPEQVQRLIKQATDHVNLCQLYIGWCYFW